jgi:hypothetical protein
MRPYVPERMVPMCWLLVTADIIPRSPIGNVGSYKSHMA